jgi:fermentation-respiration switch protein FrsA (DUF1100 family)
MWKRVLLALATISAACAAITAAFEALLRRHLYRSSGAPWSSAEDVGLPCEEAAFWTADGVALQGWYFRCQEGLPTILFLRGTRYDACDLWSDRERARTFGRFLRGTGCNFFLFDYRGFGLSGGTPSEQGTYLDAEGALAYLHTRGDVDPTRIVLYGFSLGSGVAVEVALREPCAGLILRAPFTSLRDVAESRLPALRLLFSAMPWLPLTRYDSAAKMPHVRVPVLIMHGEADESVPPWMGRRLAEMAAGPATFVALPGSHTEFPAEEAASAVRRFVEGLAGEGSLSS